MECVDVNDRAKDIMKLLIPPADRINMAKKLNN